MPRCAYLVSVRWGLMSFWHGKLTRLFTGNSDDHLGLVFFDCSHSESVAQSDPLVSDPSLRNLHEHAAFDFMASKTPKFQSITNPYFFTPSTQLSIYPVHDLDPNYLHRMCLMCARLQPVNLTANRINVACGGCWPCDCGCSTTPAISPSTCVGLTLRLLAAARERNAVLLRDDRLALQSLGLPLDTCDPKLAIGYTPSGAVEALREAGVLGPPMHSFGEAIQKSGCIGLGPLPSIILRQ